MLQTEQYRDFLETNIKLESIKSQSILQEWVTQQQATEGIHKSEQSKKYGVQTDTSSSSEQMQMLTLLTNLFNTVS